MQVLSNGFLYLFFLIANKVVTGQSSLRTLLFRFPWQSRLVIYDTTLYACSAAYSREIVKASTQIEKQYVGLD